MRKKHAYDRGRAAFVYEEWMRRSIAQYKYGGRREYAEFYAEEILLACAREMIRWKAEVLVQMCIRDRYYSSDHAMLWNYRPYLQ